MMGAVFDRNVFKVLSLFSMSPGSRFNRKEVKEKTRINNVPLDNALVTVTNIGILKKDGSLYSLDFENRNAKTIIGILSAEYRKFKEIPFHVYLVLFDLSAELSAEKGVEAYFFGSYSKLVYSEDSDVDIAVLAGKKFDKKYFKDRAGKFGKTYNKNIELHFFDKASFHKNKKDPLVKEIVKNGIRII